MRIKLVCKTQDSQVKSENLIVNVAIACRNSVPKMATFCSINLWNSGSERKMYLVYYGFDVCTQFLKIRMGLNRDSFSNPRVVLFVLKRELI